MGNPLESLSGKLKLRLLREFDGGRQWKSLDETRHCAICERIIRGHEIRVLWNRQGQARLRCPTPGCRSTPAEWVHPGNPLVSEDAWRDWTRLFEAEEGEAAVGELAAGPIGRCA